MNLKPLSRKLNPKPNVTVDLAGTRLNPEIKVLPISNLKPHEETDPTLLNLLAVEIRRDRLLRKAITVDRNTYVILDGHHRVKALKTLGCSKIPCLLIDYSAPELIVLSWKTGDFIPKNLILEAGLKGRLLPPRTSKHMIKIDGYILHVSRVEPELKIPLNLLV